MLTKIIQIPKHQLLIQGETGATQVSTFWHLLSIVIEAAPQKNDLEAYLAYALREKINKFSQSDVEEFEIEESELSFVRQGISKLREREGMTGSLWYFLIKPLQEACDKKL